jgi:hypothetical protein
MTRCRKAARAGAALQDLNGLYKQQAASPIAIGDVSHV